MDASTEPTRVPASASARPACIRFGAAGQPPRFELQPHERRLLVDGDVAPLGARAFDLLLALAERPGTLLTKNDLLDVVWPGLVVEEANLTVQVSNLRKVLGGDVLATIPGRGYRFTAVIATAVPAPAASAAPAAEIPPPRLKTNLPATLIPLLGREDELQMLHRLVAEHRLVTLLGAGGIGKTLLSQHLLRGREGLYRHGVCFADLTTVSQPAALPLALARALGLQLGSEEDALAALCRALSPLQLLLVLDNAEHLLAPVAALAAAILDATPGLRLVVTSQAPLRLGSERVHRLGPLAVPTGPVALAEARGFGAIALFESRAHAADSRFSLTDSNLPQAIAIVRQLDGVALAIELAAARAPVLGLERLAQSLGARLALLTRGSKREAPARQQTLRAALEWSHALLGPAEQVVFRRLAVMPDAAGLDMIQTIVADPAQGPTGTLPDLDEWAVLDALSELVDRSLVAVEPGSAEQARYRLLDTPRALALERLADAGEHPTLRHRHAAAWAAWARRESGDMADLELLPAELLTEVSHLAAALDEAFARDDDALALDLLPSVLRRAYFISRAESRRLTEALARLLSPAEIPSAWLLSAASACERAAISDQPRDARDWARRGLALLARLPADDRPPRLQFRLEASLGFGWTLIALGDAAQAGQTAKADEADAVSDQDADHALLQAVAALQRSEAALPAQARPVDLQFLLDLRANVAACRGLHEEALRRAREAVAIAPESRRTPIISVSIIDELLTLGRYEEALEQALGLIREWQDQRNERPLSALRLNAATACLGLSRRSEVAHEIAQRSRLDSEADPTVGSANASQPLSRLGQARELALQSWPAALRFGHDPWWADDLALLLALEGRPADAARLAGYADAAYAANDDERQPNEAAAVARARALVRAELGEAAAAALEREGAALGGEAVGRLVFGSDAGA